MDNNKISPSDQAAKDLATQLKQRIATGEYAPGQWLKQIDIANTFDVNRFAVRSAFSELSSAGFLEHIPYRGHRVIEHSVQERRQLTEAREVIECAAAEKVIGNIDETGLRNLQKLAQDFDKAAKNQQRGSMIEANFAFHHCLYSYCNNTHLSELIDDMRERGVGSANTGWSVQPSILNSSQDHFDMIQALREKNPVRLKALIHIHLNRWQRQARQS